MTLYVCGPSRFATGLLKTIDDRPKDRLMTSISFEGEIVTYTPDMKDFPTKSVYKKKTYRAEDFRSLTISINAGDVVTMYGETYDGTTIDTPITGTIEVRPVDRSEWIENMKKGEKPVEIIDLDKDENHRDNTDADPNSLLQIPVEKEKPTPSILGPNSEAK